LRKKLGPTGGVVDPKTKSEIRHGSSPDSSSFVPSTDEDHRGPYLVRSINPREQSVTGKVTGLQWEPVTSFTLKFPADSDFARRTGLRAIEVYQVSRTELRQVTLINGASVHILGLLFEDAGTLKMVAKRIAKP
jgi:hypothetical protein